jgi:hypothetical protein
MGPAACKGVEGDCSKGHSRITRRDRLDARFRNSTSKPPRKGKQTVGPPADAELSKILSNLEPGESVFDRNKPTFDRGRFKTGGRLDYTDYRLPDYKERADGRLTANLTRKARRPVNLAAATIPGAPPDLSKLIVVALVDHNPNTSDPTKSNMMMGP